jgi:hypothetical protein
MPKKPFKEKPKTATSRSASISDKDDFEDKVHEEFRGLKDRFDRFKDKMETGKPEKDEAADKYAQDKYHKDQKEQKAEKVEKEHKDILKESAKDHDVSTSPVIGIPPAVGTIIRQDTRILERIAALEEAIGRLTHFITVESRPDLSKGALKDEPDTSKTEPSQQTQRKPGR